MKKEQNVQVCPMCGSQNFNVDKSNKYLESIGSSTNYLCNNCGNIFSFPLEVYDSDAEKLLNETKGKSVNATPMEKFAPIGFFQVRVVFKIIGFLLIISSVGFIFIEENILFSIFTFLFGIIILFFSFRRDKEILKK